MIGATWKSFDEWRDCDGIHCLDGTGTNGKCDLAAEVSPYPRAPNKWLIKWWDGPYSYDTRQTRDFEGTLEEAKALATAMVKM